VVSTARPTGDPPLAAPIVPSTPRPVVLATLSVRVDCLVWIVGDS
jgi:hypothetical protein